jgi:hypothetical protein
VAVDFVDVLSEFAAWLSLDFLDLLESSALNESSLGLKVLGEDLGELGADVSQDVVWSQLEEWLEGWQVGAHLDDVLQGLLGLVLEVLGGLGEHVDGEQLGWHVSLGEELGVVWGVSSDLAERPGGGGLQVVFWLVLDGVLQWGDTLGDDDGHGEGVVEGRDVSEGHDTWKSGVTLGFTDVVNGSGGSTRVDNKFSEFGGLLGDFSNASSSVLSDLDIHILEAVEDSWEDFSLNNDFGKIDGVLGDLSKALADVSLELSVWVRDQSSQVWDSSLVNNSLGQLFSVLGDFSKSGGRDSLEGKLWLLNAKDEKSNGSSINDGLSKFMGVLGDARQSESGSLLNRWVEFFEAVDEGVKSSGVNDGLGEMWGVLGNGSQDVGGGLLVESVLLGKGVDELWEDFVGDNGFSKFVRVVGKSSEGEGSRLLDRWNVIQKEWSEEGHDTSGLEGLDVLWSLGKLGYGLHEGDSSFLVSFEWG